ncbi:hypothetical protein C7M84_001053 [Penaeus vannamei]|uniref:Peptidase M13 N-terminal domain-containing protein n=1 Tax=Penaeus vannamei TaxID=6689 RepID=A0A423TUQ3_PENVA|nr:hypothetical protein C7M84_001053 [Penaeus vannamei]
MTVAELQEKVPEIPWLQYFNTILSPFHEINIDEPVVVGVPDYVKNLGKLLTRTPKSKTDTIKLTVASLPTPPPFRKFFSLPCSRPFPVFLPSPLPSSLPHPRS